MSKKVAVFRKEHFNAAHRLHNPAWDEAKNDQVFGKCSLPNYHGHNYELEVKVVGKQDKKTGFVMDMKVLSDLIKKKYLNGLIIKTLTWTLKNSKILILPRKILLLLFMISFVRR